VTVLRARMRELDSGRATALPGTESRKSGREGAEFCSRLSVQVGVACHPTSPARSGADILPLVDREQVALRATILLQPLGCSRLTPSAIPILSWWARVAW